MFKRKMNLMLMVSGFLTLVLFTACESADKKSTEITVDSKESVTTAPVIVRDTALVLDTTAVTRPLKPGN